MVALLEAGRVICIGMTEEYLAFVAFRPVFYRCFMTGYTHHCFMSILYWNCHASDIDGSSSTRIRWQDSIV